MAECISLIVIISVLVEFTVHTKAWNTIVENTYNKEYNGIITFK